MKNLDALAIKENISLPIQSTLLDVVKLISTSSIGLIVFVNHRNIPQGVITEREVLQLLRNNVNLDDSIVQHFEFHKPITISKDRSYEYALHVLLDNGIRRLIVINTDGSLFGLINQEILIDKLENSFYKTDLLVGNFIHEYQHLVTAKTTDTLQQCINLMFIHNVGAIVLTDEHNRAVGIIDEGDIVKLSFKNIPFDSVVKEYMSSPLISTSRNALVHDTVTLMREKKIDKILIEDLDGQIKHIMSLRDITKFLQGNYEKLLESKLKTLKNSLNYIGEYIFEVYEDNGEYIIQWMNQKAIDKLGNYLDKAITNLIDVQVWDLIHYNLQNTNLINNYKIKIQNSHFEISCSNHYINDRETLLFVLKDITELYDKIETIEKDNNALKYELSILQNIIDIQNNIIFVTDGDTITLSNKAFLKFFNIKSLDTFKTIHQQFQSKLLAHHGFFFVLDIKDNWIDEILKVKESKRIISMMNKENLEPMVYKVHVTALQNSQEQYMVMLEDITQSIMEDNKHYHNATHDTMTEAYNRSFFLETLSNYIYKSKRYNLHFSIIRFNIDNIALINETDGFIEGDKKINHIISLIFKNIRTSDIIARYDSDDFILLLPQTSAVKCELICENLKSVINSENENLTVSFGITDFHIADNTSTITTRAKDALLQAKANGKNCSVRL